MSERGGMIRGLLFDLNGTLVDILTDEGDDNVYRVLSNLLSYQGVRMTPETVKELYFDLNRKQRCDSDQEYPEFDVVDIFRTMLERHATAYTRSLSPQKLALLPEFLAETFRAASRFRLHLYPEVERVLEILGRRYQIGVVSDGQTLWALPEMHAVGLDGRFDPVVISGDLGYRKPDTRIFMAALSRMKLTPAEVIYVGNDTYRDVCGAHRVGMQTVFFKSNQGDHRPVGIDPDYIIYRIEELPTAIRFIEHKLERKRRAH